MIQQVNLYQPNDATDSTVLTNPYMLTVLAVSLLLALMSGWGINNLHSNRNERKQMLAQIQQTQTRLQELRAQNPNQQIDSLLNQELQQTQSYYQNLSQILELLADTQSDRIKGYSGYFSALAEQADNNVWITGIRINSETGNITLKGSTFKADQIPLLLQRLQKTSAFKGRHFARLSIQQEPQTPEQVDFSVSSSQVPEKEEFDDHKH